MSLPVGKERISVEEYFRREEVSVDKHEFHDGEVLMMGGGSENHSLIITNVIGEIRSRLKGKPCRVYDSNLRVRISHKVTYVYPDVVVICGKSERDPRDASGGTITNPRLIVEVLSPSTAGYDRGSKFDDYRRIESLQEYVLIWQDEPRVETFTRQQNGSWLLTPTSGMSSTLQLRSLEIAVPLSELFAGVEFVPEAAE